MVGTNLKIKDIENSELHLLIKTLRSEGVLCFKYGQLEIELIPDPQIPNEIKEIEIEGTDLTDEELLYFSSE